MFRNKHSHSPNCTRTIQTFLMELGTKLYATDAQNASNYILSSPDFVF